MPVLMGLATGALLLAGLEAACRLFAAPAAPEPDPASLAFSQAQERDLFVPDTELFWRLRPGLDVSYAGVAVRTNSLGLRGPEPRSPAVIALGDSVAFGFEVAEEESWPRRLESALGSEVLVAAVPGYTAHQGRQLLRELLARFTPRVVVISFGYNDARLFPFSDDEAARGARARAGGPSRLEGSALYRRVRALSPAGRNVTRARELLALRAHDLAAFPPADAAAARQLARDEDRIRAILGRSRERVPLADYRDDLRAMVRMCVARGAHPVLLATPYGRDSFEPYFAASRFRTPIADYRRVMQEVARDEDAGFVRLTPLEEGIEASTLRQMFVTRPLSEAEREGWRLIGLTPKRAYELGISSDRKQRIDFVHPSAQGHGLIAQELGVLLGRYRVTAPHP